MSWAASVLRFLLAAAVVAVTGCTSGSASDEKPPAYVEAPVILEFSLEPFDDSETPNLITVSTKNNSEVEVSDSQLLVLEHWDDGWQSEALLPLDFSGPEIPRACGPDLNAEDCTTESLYIYMTPGAGGRQRTFRLPELPEGVYRLRPLYDLAAPSSSPYVELT